MVRVLGISAFYHDSAVALVDDGRIVGAAQEERFTRKRHDARFPDRALTWLLESSATRLADIDYVVFYEKPFLKLERLLETYLACAPRGFSSFRAAMSVWLDEKLFQKRAILQALRAYDPDFTSRRLLFSEHHLSHAASAFFPSPFEQAAVLTLDGVGEWATVTSGVGEGSVLRIDREQRFPHSLGLLYSAFTYQVGFRVNSGEYKLMGLAPYGEPRFVKEIEEHLIDLRPDGSFRLNLDYFDFATGLRMTNPRFDALFGGPPRQATEPLTERHMDMARSIQEVTERVVVALGRDLARRTKMSALCLSGGVALNCVANGKLLADGCFENIFIQPAAGDAGGALGAALLGYYLKSGGPRRVFAEDAMRGALLGPDFSDSAIEKSLLQMDARFERLTPEALIERTVDALCEGGAVGFFQGPMELGPRALGARSILCDPRRPDAQRVLNSKIKQRESFRPFAPAVLREEAAGWFQPNVESPYMLLVFDVKEAHRLEVDPSLTGLARLGALGSTIPAVTHVDGSARVQTVDEGRFPRFHALLRGFFERTGCPVLVNTSFNVRGEPIVCTPEDAFRCFLGSGLDALAIGNFFVRRDEQAVAADPEYIKSFAPD